MKKELLICLCSFLPLSYTDSCENIKCQQQDCSSVSYGDITQKIEEIQRLEKVLENFDTQRGQCYRILGMDEDDEEDSVQIQQYTKDQKNDANKQLK